MIVVVCPGQGSQTPGFLSPWLELDGVGSRLDAYAEAAKVDLRTHGTVSDADTIRDTQIAQPLIVAASLIAWDALQQRIGADSLPQPGGIAGHSVGEVAALVGAGVLNAEDGMRLVGVRGRAMAEAAEAVPTGMAAVLGGDEAAVLARLSELDLTPANYNGAGQIVAAGTLDAIASLQGDPVSGSRVIPLQVAGAFHTRFMEPAVQRLREAAADVTPSDPDRLLWSNHDGTVVSNGTSALELLVGQVASPVRWDLCMQSFSDNGITGLIELTPAGTLTGLAKRALRGVPAVAVKTPEDLDAAAALITEAAA